MDLVVGIDEVGRGCWAGPLVAAAVVLTQPVSGLMDSKLLSKRRREELALQIKQTAVYGLGWVAPAEIDAIGLTAATTLAMSEALTHIQTSYAQIIIDGNYNYLSEYPMATPLIKADQTIPAVSAASVLAKVSRDEYMAAQALLFPGYGFEKHVGYGTVMHLAALKQLGLCEIHRKSYKPVRAFIT